MDKRTRARELTIQALYQFDVQGPDVLEPLKQFFIEADTNNAVRSLASEWMKGTSENLEKCDELITASTIKWQFTRLSPVDRSIIVSLSIEILPGYTAKSRDKRGHRAGQEIQHGQVAGFC